MTYKPFLSLDQRAEEAAQMQMKTRLMSGFVGAKGDDFYGGEQVKLLEAKCEEVYGFSNAISVNSWTSGLLLMVEALGLDDERDEIIVTPWTMSATVFAIIQAGFMPVFADIDENSFMPNIETISKVVTDRTRAIMVADIFGQSFPYETLEPLRKRGIKVLSDAAQSHLALRHGEPVGFSTECSGISLNRHKHINTGEGGIILTNNDEFAERCRQSRNHGENLDFNETKMVNMIGYNFRLTETQAAIGLTQLDLLENIVGGRQELATIADGLLGNSKYFDAVPPLPGNTHSYYIYPMLVKAPFRSRAFVEHVRRHMIGSGFPSPLVGYQNIQALDFFQNPDATSGRYSRYCTQPSCPMAEHLHDCGFMGILFCNSAFDTGNLTDYLAEMENAGNNF